MKREASIGGNPGFWMISFGVLAMMLSCAGAGRMTGPGGDGLDMLKNAGPKLVLAGEGGNPARIGVAPLRGSEKTKALNQVTGLWIAAHLVHAGGLSVFPPDKVRGALSKAGFRLEELTDSEIAASARALLGLDYLIQGEVSQASGLRGAQVDLWKLPSMNSQVFLDISAKGGFSVFRRKIARALLTSFPIEGPVSFEEDDKSQARKIKVPLGWSQGIEEGAELVLYRPSTIYGGPVILATMHVTLVESASSHLSISKWLAPAVRPRPEEGDIARLIK